MHQIHTKRYSESRTLGFTDVWNDETSLVNASIVFSSEQSQVIIWPVSSASSDAIYWSVASTLPLCPCPIPLGIVSLVNSHINILMIFAEKRKCNITLIVHLIDDISALAFQMYQSTWRNSSTQRFSARTKCAKHSALSP